MPLVGTWIEIYPRTGRDDPGVVPLVGTWIEIGNALVAYTNQRRAPRGHVD